MTNTKLTPPPELVQQWDKGALGTHCRIPPYGYSQFIANRAAQWGWDQRKPEIQAAADAELEACCEWFASKGYTVSLRAALRAARRPKPPSLKEQALTALKDMNLSLDDGHNASIIRQALEQLND
jgi:hypothetical protein